MVIGYKFVSIPIFALCKRFKIWPNIFCAFSTIFSGGGSIRVAKRRRIALFETDLETVKKNLTEGQFTVKDNVGHGNGAFWSAYQNILTNDGTCTNYIRCRFCSKVNKYDTKKNGTIVRACTNLHTKTRNRHFIHLQRCQSNSWRKKIAV